MQTGTLHMRCVFSHITKLIITEQVPCDLDRLTLLTQSTTYQCNNSEPNYHPGRFL